MQTRKIPASGAALPVIGCGTWIGFDVAATPAELPARSEVLATLFGSGGRVVDSSPMYGSAEQVVGDLLGADEQRSKAFLATRSGPPASAPASRRWSARWRCYARSTST